MELRARSHSLPNTGSEIYLCMDVEEAEKLIEEMSDAIKRDQDTIEIELLHLPDNIPVNVRKY